MSNTPEQEFRAVLNPSEDTDKPRIEVRSWVVQATKKRTTTVYMAYRDRSTTVILNDEDTADLVRALLRIPDDNDDNDESE